MIELLVVIVIIAILLAIAVPAYLSQQKKAKDLRAKTNDSIVYREARTDVVGSTGYPSSTSIVADASSSSEPQLTIVRGTPSQAMNASANTVVVGSTSTSNLFYAFSPGAGNRVIGLSATATGAPSFWQVTYPDFIVGDSPSAYWQLNEGVGTTMSDFTSGAHNGTYYGSPTLNASGQINSAVSFNGSSQYAEVPYSAALNPSSSFTVEQWVYPTGGAGTTRSPLTSRSTAGGLTYGYLFYAYSDDSWQFWLGKGTVNWTMLTGSSVSLNQWTLLDGVYDASTGKASFYVNGQLVAGPTATPFAANTTQPLRIGAGRTESTPNWYFPGRIDDSAFYPSALNATQIAEHYAAGIGS